jgi:hypothetical protein
MTEIPDKHSGCGHKVENAYQAVVETATTRTAQISDIEQNTMETAEKDSVESGISGSIKGSLAGLSASVKGYVKGKTTTVDKESTSEVHHESESLTANQLVRVEPVDKLENAEGLGCQKIGCPNYYPREQHRIRENRSNAQVTLSDGNALTTAQERALAAPNPTHEYTEYGTDPSPEGPLEPDPNDDKYTVTGLGDNITEEDKLGNVIQANQNDPDPSDEYTVTGLGDGFDEDDKLENIMDRNNPETEQDNRSVSDTSSENNDDRNDHDDRDTDRTRGRR